MKIYIKTYEKRRPHAEKLREHLKDSPYEFYFVYARGNKNKVEPYIEVDSEEKYEYLPEKTFGLITHFLESSSDEKLVKMNDDVFLDFSKLPPYEKSQSDYTGFFLEYSRGQFSKFIHWYKVSENYKVLKRQFHLMYAEGAMYILSRKACELVVSKGREFFANTPETYLGEDVKVGMSLNVNDIVKEDIKVDNDYGYDITKDFLSVHPISLLIFDKLKSAKTNEEKMKILVQFNFLNENALRMEYLIRTKQFLMEKNLL